MNFNFVLMDALPDASSIFNRSYRSVDEIKGDCLVALDTNVLLAPYKLGASSFGKITEIYGKLAGDDRLVIPSHVAREYARQRTVELSNLVKALRDQSSRSSSPIQAKIPFLEEDDNYKAAKVASDETEKKISQSRKLLDKVINGLSDPINGDPVLSKYSEIFSKCLHDIEIPDRDIFEQNCEYRFSNNIPPGYHDASKTNNAIGDVIIWKTIIEAANEKKSDVIFVTGDEKSDWWVRHDKSPFQPRYELIDEFARETGGKTIHLVPLHRLVELFEGGAAAVKETEQVERLAATPQPFLQIGNPGRPGHQLAGLKGELNDLRLRLAKLERSSSALASTRSNDRVSLEIADQISLTKSRIRAIERFLYRDDDGPNYSLAGPDE